MQPVDAAPFADAGGDDTDGGMLATDPPPVSGPLGLARVVAYASLAALFGAAAFMVMAWPEGVDYITSNSVQGTSTIQVYIKLNFDPNQALTEVLVIAAALSGLSDDDGFGGMGPGARIASEAVRLRTYAKVKPNGQRRKQSCMTYLDGSRKK